MLRLWTLLAGPRTHTPRLGDLGARPGVRAARAHRPLRDPRLLQTLTRLGQLQECADAKVDFMEREHYDATRTLPSLQTVRGRPT